MRVDSTGDILWAGQMGGTGTSIGHGVASDGAEGAIVTGYFHGGASFGTITLTGTGIETLFVARVSPPPPSPPSPPPSQPPPMSPPSPTHPPSPPPYPPGWTLSFRVGGSYHRGDVGRGVASDGADGMLVTGFFFGTVTFGSTSLTSYGFQWSKKPSSVFAMRVDSSGSFLWAVHAGSMWDNAQGVAIASDGTGGALVTGTSVRATRF